MVDIKEFAERLATALTTGDENWKIDPDSTKYHSERHITNGEIGLKNQFGLSLELDGHTRVVIKPLTPVGIQLNGSPWHYTYGKPSISLNGERPINQVARDIRRRLMSDAVTWWNQNYTNAAQSIESRSKVQMFQQTLLQYPDAHCTGGGGPSEISGTGWTMRTDSSPTHLEIKFTNLPHSKIIQLLDLYYQHILKQGDFSYGR